MSVLKCTTTTTTTTTISTNKNIFYVNVRVITFYVRVCVFNESILPISTMSAVHMTASLHLRITLIVYLNVLNNYYTDYVSIFEFTGNTNIGLDIRGKDIVCI